MSIAKASFFKAVGFVSVLLLVSLPIAGCGQQSDAEPHFPSDRIIAENTPELKAFVENELSPEFRADAVYSIDSVVEKAVGDVASYRYFTAEISLSDADDGKYSNISDEEIKESMFKEGTVISSCTYDRHEHAVSADWSGNLEGTDSSKGILGGASGEDLDSIVWKAPDDASAKTDSR